MWKIKSHFYVKPRVNLILLNGAELLISKCGCYIRISCIPQIKNEKLFFQNNFSISCTAWKKSKYGVISGPYFDTFLAVMRL